MINVNHYPAATDSETFENALRHIEDVGIIDSAQDRSQPCSRQQETRIKKLQA